MFPVNLGFPFIEMFNTQIWLNLTRNLFLIHIGML